MEPATGGQYPGGTSHGQIPHAGSRVGLLARLDRGAAEIQQVNNDRHCWPVQDPGVVLDAVPSTAHGAGLGCPWFDVRGHWMGHADWFERASIWQHRPQVSDGV